MAFTDVTNRFLSLKKIKRTKLFKNIPKTLMIEFVIQKLCKYFTLSGLLTSLLDILSKRQRQNASQEITLQTAGIGNNSSGNTSLFRSFSLGKYSASVLGSDCVSMRLFVRASVSPCVCASVRPCVCASLHV